MQCSGQVHNYLIGKVGMLESPHTHTHTNRRFYSSFRDFIAIRTYIGTSKQQKNRRGSALPFDGLRTASGGSKLILKEPLRTVHRQFRYACIIPSAGSCSFPNSVVCICFPGINFNCAVRPENFWQFLRNMFDVNLDVMCGRKKRVSCLCNILD